MLSKQDFLNILKYYKVSIRKFCELERLPYSTFLKHFKASPYVNGLHFQRLTEFLLINGGKYDLFKEEDLNELVNLARIYTEK